MTISTLPRTAATDKLPADDALHAVIYMDFLYGFGVGPTIDLGAPLTYTKAPTSAGSVYRQQFEHGMAVANLGDEAAEVVLEHPYYDLDNMLRTKVVLPAHTAEVLLSEPAA